MKQSTLFPRVPILAAAIVVGLIVLPGCGNDDGSDSATATTDVVATADVAATGDPVQSTGPSTTAPPVAASPTTTEFVNPFSDAEIASRLLLNVEEYAPGWQLYNGFKPVSFDAGLAASIPACAPFVEPVFGADQPPNSTDWRWFHTPPGMYGAMNQFVVVFPSEEAAQAMFDATVDPSFTDACIGQYHDALVSRGDGYCCDPAVPAFPALLGDVIPTGDTLHADDIAFRSAEETWTDGAGKVHGPDSLQKATVRVGRTVTIIETLLTDGSGNRTNTDEQFHRAIGAVVDRARHALGGVDHGS